MSEKKQTGLDKISKMVEEAFLEQLADPSSASVDVLKEARMYLKDNGYQAVARENSKMLQITQQIDRSLKAPFPNVASSS